MHTLLSYFGMFIFYSVCGFPVFYFGSKPTERELDRREALMSALVLAITAIATSILGPLYGTALTFFLVVSMLIRVYDCGLLSSLFMTIGAQLLPFALSAGLQACLGD